MEPSPETADTPATDRNETAEARAGRLLAVICHDLRAPLASIVMGVGFIQQSVAKLDGLATEKRILEGLLRSSDRMNALIGDLHDVAHIDTGTFSIASRRMALGALWAAVVEAQTAKGAKKSVAITSTEAPAEGQVDCDRDRIVQAVGRLVDNAVRYSATGGTVALAAGVSNGRVWFSVEDDGHGMTAERLPHAFDYRWHSAQSPRDGTGLGLSLVRGVAIAHGGDAEIVSPKPGGSAGTRASFWIPAA